MQYANRRYVVLTVLLVIGIFQYLDRVTLALVLQNIKLELSLSDTQLGLLSGFSFALFYSVMGIPIARWADRGNRVTIIGLTTAVWSVGVALCGVATNFVQLLLVRVGVAVGEAGCHPPAYSLIADYFDRSERPRAVAIYGLGGPLSALLGYSAAGWLNEMYGWRITFILMGLPGVLLAVVAWMVLKEPRLSRVARPPGSQHPIIAEAQPTMREVAATLSSDPTFRHLLICLSLMFFFMYGTLQWQPSFLIRSYHLATTELGLWLAIGSGVAGFVGTYLGGELATKYAMNNERQQLRAVALAVLICSVFQAGSYIAHDKYWTLGLAMTAGFGIHTISGPLFATIQTLVPERMRAVSFAVIFLFANLIGMGCGPLAVGMLSDAMGPMLGNESLRYALLMMSPGYIWSAWHAWCASRTVAQSITTLEAKEAGGAHSDTSPEGTAPSRA